MQLRYIRPFSQYQPGDVVEVPDGAAFSDFYLERVPPADPPADDPPADPPAPEAPEAPDPAPADPPRLPYPAKEM